MEHQLPQHMVVEGFADDIQRLIDLFRAMSETDQDELFAQATRILARRRIADHAGTGAPLMDPDDWLDELARDSMADDDRIRDLFCWQRPGDPMLGYVFSNGIVDALARSSSNDYAVADAMRGGLQYLLCSDDFRARAPDDLSLARLFGVRITDENIVDGSTGRVLDRKAWERAVDHKVTVYLVRWLRDWRAAFLFRLAFWQFWKPASSDGSTAGPSGDTDRHEPR